MVCYNFTGNINRNMKRYCLRWAVIFKLYDLKNRKKNKKNLKLIFLERKYEKIKSLYRFKKKKKKKEENFSNQKYKVFIINDLTRLDTRHKKKKEHERKLNFKDVNKTGQKRINIMARIKCKLQIILPELKIKI